MGRFQKRSLRNVQGVTQMRSGPGCPFVNPARVHLGEVAAAVKAQSLTRQYRKIARFDAVSDARITTTSSTEMVTGLHRCAEADLVIVRNLSILHDVSALAADVDLAVSFFYVVAFGAAVVTATHFVAARCSPMARTSSAPCLSRPRIEDQVCICPWGQVGHGASRRPHSAETRH